MSEREYYRYESPELKLWKKLTADKQFERVSGLSQIFKEKLKVIDVHNQSIKVELYVQKDDVYDVLVTYEAYLREKLNNIPIIVLLEGKTDANKKRQ
ncbi:hypothetical protein [Sulfurimonas denitrificans]|uniref:hypothetical protein n=1 Tax=Sulfurimonas denitrificans TaxID=39766 RepID=UPI0000571E24|nr:hypothetical protein [Sulfurimonas denitrificans]MDD3442931.1 hypothetical protein [Sulfurimonas denitrificans]